MYRAKARASALPFLALLGLIGAGPLGALAGSAVAHPVLRGNIIDRNGVVLAR